MTDQPADKPIFVHYWKWMQENKFRIQAEDKIKRIKKILDSQKGATEMADYFTILSNIEDIVKE